MDIYMIMSSADHAKISHFIRFIWERHHQMAFVTTVR